MNYTTRERVKRALKLSGSDRDSVIDAAIATATDEIEELTNRKFIPRTETHAFSWPQRDHRGHYLLYLDDDLLTLTALTKDGATQTVIPVSDVFLEPGDLGPPYYLLELDRSTSVFFSAGNTPQRAIRATGQWGFSNDTAAAGLTAEALDNSETDLNISDASLVDVGDTILVETEAMQVTERALLDTAADLNGALTADVSEVTVTVDDATKVLAGEVIQVDSEKMLVESISGNDLSVLRSFDGSTLAAHNNSTSVFASRTLTVVRGANGTTVATHDTAKAITKYVVPGSISGLCLALATAYYEQGQIGWTGAFGGGLSTASETLMVALDKMRIQVKKAFKRRVIGAV